MLSTHKGILYAAITTLLWGVLGIMLKAASHFIDAYSLVWIRFVIALVCILPFYGLRAPHKLRLFMRPPALLLLASVFLSLNYLGFMRGIELTSPSNAQVLGQIGPILLVVFGVVLLKERLSWQQLVGILCAAVGFYMFFEDQVSSLLMSPSAYTLGIVWIAACSVTWALFAISVKMLVDRFEPQILNAFMYGIGIFLFLPFVNFSVFASLSLGDWALVLALGLNTLLSYGFLAASFKHLNASTVAMITTLSPVLCVLFMTALSMLHLRWVDPEFIHPIGYLGAAFTVVGAALVVRYQGARSERVEPLAESTP